MMSRTRIHIEIVIGRLKDFKIIKGPLSINLVKRKPDCQVKCGDRIMQVAAAIVNTNNAFCEIGVKLVLINEHFIAIACITVNKFNRFECDYDSIKYGLLIKLSMVFLLSGNVELNDFFPLSYFTCH